MLYADKPILTRLTSQHSNPHCWVSMVCFWDHTAISTQYTSGAHVEGKDHTHTSPGNDKRITFATSEVWRIIHEIMKPLQLGEIYLCMLTSCFKQLSHPFVFNKHGDIWGIGIAYLQSQNSLGQRKSVHVCMFVWIIWYVQPRAREGKAY